MIQKLKDKKAAIQSTDFVIFFLLAVILVLILIEITFAVFAIYNTNVTATNVARIVSVNGEIDSTQSKKLYELASSQLSGKIVDDSLSITLKTNTANTEYVPAQTVVIKNGQYPSYKVNLGDEFTVRLEGKINLFHVSSIPVTSSISGSSVGVGEVYFKALR